MRRLAGLLVLLVLPAACSSSKAVGSPTTVTSPSASPAPYTDITDLALKLGFSCANSFDGSGPADAHATASATCSYASMQLFATNADRDAWVEAADRSKGPLIEGDRFAIQLISEGATADQASQFAAKVGGSAVS